MPRSSNAERNQAVGMLQAGQSKRQVASQVARHFHCSPSTVSRLQQDNARPHTARITMAFLGEHGVNVLPWPSYSPDMSPIEHLWDQLGRRIRNLNPRSLTRHQLIAALHAEWANIPQDSIRRLIRSMRRRCRACVAQHGGHTPY